MLNAEDFELKFWNIEVENREYPMFSKDVSACSTRIYVSSVGQELNFGWRSLTGERTELSYGIPVTTSWRDAYTGTLGYNYLLGLTGSEQASLPSGVAKEIYFLLTFKESKFAYLAVRTGLGGSFHEGFMASELSGVPLLLPIPGDYELRIRFRADGEEEAKGHKFKLHIEAYDKVTLTHD